MEVVIPSSPIMEFDFNSARSSPRSSAPSTPRRFGAADVCYFSAPTSPTRMSDFYREFEMFNMIKERQESSSSSANIPFDWEEKPGTPKLAAAAAGDIDDDHDDDDDDDDDFAFDFSVDLEKASLPAEELFDGGKIKPLKPPPRLQIDDNVNNMRSYSFLSSPRPRSPLSKGKRMVREAFSPRSKKKDRDPFETAIETSRNAAEQQGGRGRERVQDNFSRNSSRRAARSLSPTPYRSVSELYPWQVAEQQQQQQQPHDHDDHDHETNDKQSTAKQPSLTDSSSSKSSSSSSRKWRLRDFLLFRSASEGRAADKDPLRKYSAAFFKKPEDIKNSSSFRSTDSGGGGGGSRRKVSAHERHYKTNKAVSENMRKQTFLPYKQGILGRLAFNPALHALSNGFGTLTRT